MNIVHVTSVHPTFDNRIFYKQCRSIADAGINVYLVAPHPSDEVFAGVRIKSAGYAQRRLQKLFSVMRTTLGLVRTLKPAVVHLHDPELIGLGLLLRLKGQNVVFDVHEDYITSIRQKPYLPKLMRRFLSNVIGTLENVCYRAFHIVLAERYYKRRFPQGTLVLNYPSTELFEYFPEPQRVIDVEPPRLIYTGGITLDRGACQHALLLHGDSEIEVHMFGRRDEHSTKIMLEAAAEHRNRLVLHGDGKFVPFSEIVKAYRQGGWLAGLAIFPETDHYVQKELTKFFEYMACGLPLIVSDFKVWRELLEPAKCAIFVNPTDRIEMTKAVEWLRNHPQAGRQMGINGYHYVRAHFGWDDQAARLINLYRSIAN